MEDPKRMPGIGSHSEFGKLREVVIGTANDLFLPPFGNDLSHYNTELRDALVANADCPLNVAAAFPERHEATVRQIQEIVSLLEGSGVAVHRPRRYRNKEITYLESLQKGHSQLYPADPVFVLGKHYMELSIRRAYRRKEVFPLRDIVLPMIESDDEAHYVAMPQSDPWFPSGEGKGPFLEGGDILVHDKDVFVGVGEICSNLAGVDWLGRYIGRWGYSVHPVPIRGQILHALGIMCLLREGLLMAHLPALEQGLPEPLKHWDVIEITEDEMLHHATVGLSLDERTHIIDNRHERVINLLKDRGIEPVPVACDAVGFWGGTVRCLTLPLVRDQV